MNTTKNATLAGIGAGAFIIATINSAPRKPLPSERFLLAAPAKLPVEPRCKLVDKRLQRLAAIARHHKSRRNWGALAFCQFMQGDAWRARENIQREKRRLAQIGDVDGWRQACRIESALSE